MTNYVSKILNNAKSALAAQQAVIANRGNNIANVNTPGYSRRLVSLETATGATTNQNGLAIGNGVQVGGIRRAMDAFLDAQVRSASASSGSNEIENEFLSRTEALFSLSGNRQTIGGTLTEFFTSINDLSANPSSIELRSNMIEKSQDLVDSIRNTYNSLAGLQDEADQRIQTEVATVNSITGQIAELNGQIKSREADGSGVEAADERDQREQLINQLSEKMSFQRVDLADGTVTLNLSNGFPLVNGTSSRTLQTTTTPSFASSGSPPSLSGKTLSYIVYDYDTTGTAPAHIDLTSSIGDGEGSIAGLLSMRGIANTSQTTPFQANGTLVEMASRVEALTRNLLTSFNQTYLGPDRGDPATTTWDPTSADLNGSTPQVFGFFDFTFSGVKDGNPVDGRPQTTDLDNIVATTNVRNFSSILKLYSSDPRTIAAGRDTVTPLGSPLNVSPGNNDNLVALAALQTQSFTFSAGSFSTRGTLDDAYNEAVSHIGNVKSASDVDLTVARDGLVTANKKRDAVSGVSLDEEFTSLIQDQKAYQASAKMIKIGDDLITQIVELI